MKDSSAAAICLQAAGLVSGDRAALHGDLTRTHENIAMLWSAWLALRRNLNTPLDAHDVAIMMGLLKMARTQSGAHNPDDYVDQAGYAGIAGDIAAGAQGRCGLTIPLLKTFARALGLSI